MIPRYTREEMASIWSEDAKFQLWMEIEILALEAMVKLGWIPEKVLSTVRAKAKVSADRILEIEKKVKHDVIAFLTCLNESIGEESRYLHLGMTSSDLLDTCFSVQLCRATDLILNDLEQLMAATKKLAYAYKNTICVGRSHGIHAEPMTFGLKVASWFAELKRQQERIMAARTEIAVGALSGPVGTFAHLTPAVEAYVCEKLGLRPEPVSSQIIPRDRHAVLFTAYAQLGNTLDRICTEVRHLQRTEVREAEEQFTAGQKGSSAMPHKRNPILSENVCGLARLLRGWAWSSMENVVLWHERDISHSSVERVVGPDMTVALDFMLHRTTSIVENLVVYPENMMRNLEMTHGLVFSGSLLVVLAKKGLSREAAYDVVQRNALALWDDISKSSHPGAAMNFQDRVKADPEVEKLLTPAELEEAFSLNSHITYVDTIFARVFGS